MRSMAIFNGAGKRRDFKGRTGCEQPRSAMRCVGSGDKKYTLARTPFVEAEEEKYQSAEGWPYGDGPQ
jgi:hypothetical protein